MSDKLSVSFRLTDQSHNPADVDESEYVLVDDFTDRVLTKENKAVSPKIKVDSLEKGSDMVSPNTRFRQFNAYANNITSPFKQLTAYKNEVAELKQILHQYNAKKVSAAKQSPEDKIVAKQEKDKRFFVSPG